MGSSIFYRNQRQKRRCRKLRTNYCQPLRLARNKTSLLQSCFIPRAHGRTVNYDALVKLNQAGVLMAAAGMNKKGTKGLGHERATG